MSAYMVTDDTINNIINRLAQNNYHFDWVKQQLNKVLGYELDLRSWEDKEKLGQIMFKMNHEAIKERYGEESKVSDWRTEEFKYKSELVNNFQAIKSLENWLYQCSEGKVVNDPLYKLFDNEIKIAFMKSVLEEIEGYKMASWG